MRRAVRTAVVPLTALAAVLSAVTAAIPRPPSADPGPLAYPRPPGDMPDHVDPPPEHPPHPGRSGPVKDPPPVQAPTPVTPPASLPAETSQKIPRKPREIRRPATYKAAAVPEPVPITEPAPGQRRVQSSAYCDHGSTADGSPTVREGGQTVAAWGHAPMGSTWRVLTGRWAGLVVRIADISSRANRHRLDIWVQDCGEAISYGVPWVLVEPAG